MTLHKLLEALYGVKTRPVENPVTDSIGVTAERILQTNPNRLSFTIVNLSANAVYISPSSDVSSSKGIYLAPNGGTFVLDWTIDFELASHEWHAIAAGAGSTIYVLANLSE